MRLPPQTHPESLTLRVQRLEHVLPFYTDQLGLEPTRETGKHITLAPPDSEPLIHLHQDAQAPRRPARTVGLYHYALLLPDRASLARILKRLQAQDAAFVGFADHGVSEALYLQDPEGNGVELYRDRAPDAWPRQGDEIAMVTKPLPLDDLLAEANEPAGLAPATRVGHIHLHVGDLANAGPFYETLGFHPTQTSYPGALFLAAGDYHHHVGLNEWAGDQQAPDDATGLTHVDWSTPAARREGLEDAWHDAGLDPQATPQGVEVMDPIGITHRFLAR